MRIGELAAKAGATASRIRFYEAKGLLAPPARRETGYRDYDESAITALALINRGRRLGYTLKEIAFYLRTPEGDARRSMLTACIDGKLAQFDAILAETQDRVTLLRTLKRQLRKTGRVQG